MVTAIVRSVQQTELDHHRQILVTLYTMCLKKNTHKEVGIKGASERDSHLHVQISGRLSSSSYELLNYKGCLSFLVQNVIASS